MQQPGPFQSRTSTVLYSVVVLISNGSLSIYQYYLSIIIAEIEGVNLGI